MKVKAAVLSRLNKPRRNEKTKRHCYDQVEFIFPIFRVETIEAIKLVD
jgi:hypothetical protein